MIVAEVLINVGSGYFAGSDCTDYSTVRRYVAQRKYPVLRSPARHILVGGPS